MLYAKVVLGLPVEGPFDYIVPPDLENTIQSGKRVWVPFRNKKMLGYIVGTSRYTHIKYVKPLYDVIDQIPVLSKELLRLTRQIGWYYLCSWGEAIEAALPKGLRRGKKIQDLQRIPILNYPKQRSEVLLLHDLTGCGRWDIYWQQMQQALSLGRGAMFLSPEIGLAAQARSTIQDRLKQEVALLHSKQTDRENLVEWLKVKNNQSRIVVGSRLAVFAPINNLGLIIVDNENDPSFKQDQVPHYNAREVAFMRAGINKANLILSSTSPALESIYLARKNKIKYRLLKENDLAELEIIDMKKETYSKVRKSILSYPLQDMLNQAFKQKQKALIFLNRKGFATLASCRNCRTVLRCPRCNVNLVYHFKEDRLLCHYCNYSIEPPEICPDCNTSYIQYSGIGTEKVESELARFYPSARILRLDRIQDPRFLDADIIISTISIFKQKLRGIDLVGVITLDNSLNRVDFRAAEKTFSILLSIISLGAKRLVIQTNLANHYCFKAILNKDIESFYDQELRFRRQLRLPPYSHIVFVKLRGRNQERVKSRSHYLFDKLNKINKDKAVKIVSCFASSPAKLRGNYYWQILIKSASVRKIGRFLKKDLRKFRPSGIIVTVDVDPM